MTVNHNRFGPGKFGAPGKILAGVPCITGIVLERQGLERHVMCFEACYFN